jgi:ATP-dependent Zn protease
MISLFRRAVFILCLLFLAVMLWRLLTVSRSPQAQLSYPAFMQTLDAGKIQKVTIFMGYDLADLQLQMRDSSKAFVNDVSTKELPALIKKMMDDGVSVEFSKAHRFEPAEFILNILPIILLGAAVTYFLYIRQKAKA